MYTESTKKRGFIYKNPIEILQNLIRFDTTNPPGNEEKCIKYLNDILTDAGFETKILFKDTNRPNLITRFTGQGKTTPILIYGHVDVVTTENQEWKYPPFEGKIAEGYLWGRGALDMKSGVVMMISALLRAKAENLTPPGDIVLAIVSDEEAGGIYGSRYLVENHSNLFKEIRYAIGEFGGFTFYIGKNKFYPIMVSEKHHCFVKVIVKGPSGHGSLPMHGGAAAKAGCILNKLDKYNLPVHITEITKLQLNTMASNLSFPSNLFMRLLNIPIFTNKILKLLGKKGDVFDPLLHNTVNVTSVHGGEQKYGIPSKIEINLAATLLPGYNADNVISEIKKIIGDEFEYKIFSFEPAPYKLDMSLFDTLKDILHKIDPKGVALPILLSSPTDGRFFSKLGIQTYGFIPMTLPEEMNFSQLLHNANERIPVEAIDFGTNSIYKLLQSFK